MSHESEYFKFEIGDIIRENEVIAWHEKSPLIGMVVQIQRNHYKFYYSVDYDSQDRLTILWFGDSYIECLPSDLVTLVSRP